MSSKAKRLGSLADIFQSELLEGSIRKIKITKITPSQVQPRKERQKGVEELAESLKQDGLLQPIIVTREPDDSYKIIAGERRYHAARLLGWAEIECKILNKDEKETYRLAVIENLQRENLTPYEEVEAIALLKEKFRYTDSELGAIFGKSRNYINELLSVHSLGKSGLESCREAGIESKNLLVQAAQASKNGDLNGFLKKFQAGIVKTVKDAKEYNKTQKESSESPEKRVESNKIQTNIKYQMTRVGRELIITFDDPSSAEFAILPIQNILNQLKNPQK